MVQTTKSPELIKLNVAQKKMERNAKKNGASSSNFLNDGNGTLGSHTYNEPFDKKRKKIVDIDNDNEHIRRRDKMKKALKYMNEIAERMKMKFRNSEPNSPDLSFTTEEKKVENVTQWKLPAAPTALHKKSEGDLIPSPKHEENTDFPYHKEEFKQFNTKVPTKFGPSPVPDLGKQTSYSPAKSHQKDSSPELKKERKRRYTTTIETMNNPNFFEAMESLALRPVIK
eukprot:TRINITY_DN4790_c0_g1_i1.p1 TRINITY_DN4790_c0_g1~~TRINITY_DN4790_c0_g1_i1.p1  ORF type:complete len:227 (-),score=61.11 TRINITY_DN4790_c0_g1_i1:38-718(-)